MKKKITAVLTVILLAQLVFAPLAQAAEKGGFVPCLIGLVWGPRTGYMWNDGYKLRTMEYIELGGYLTSWIFGLGALVVIVERVIGALDVMHGTTWSQIVQKEALHASHFDSWHNYAAVR